jgi:hypothetical protein
LRTVESNGNRLVHHLVRSFETDDLRFVESEIESLDLPAADVIRCMNVLVYFSAGVRKTLLRRAGRNLAEGGIIIAGTNGMNIDGRYTIYRCEGETLSAEEFAFGMENLRTFGVMPWFTIHDEDPEALFLAGLMGAIRSNRAFWPDFTARVDELLEVQGVCSRQANGFLYFASADMPPGELMGRHAEVWRRMKAEGYPAGAVEALSRAEFTAWENPVGDIAVRPPDGTLS